MGFEENVGRLRLFGIPQDGAPEETDRARRILARLLEAESLPLSDLQTARDVVRLSPGAGPSAFLFLAAMFLSVRGGNTFLRPEKGPALLEDGGHLDEGDGGGDGAPSFAGEIAAAWPDAVAAAAALDPEIVLNRPDGKGDRWFFQRNANAVDAVSEAFSALAARPGGTPLSPGERAKAAAFRDFELDGPQLRAVESAASRRFTVITGGPGTGKTTIVFAILRALVSRGLSTEDIALAAPTGRAAQRMGEALREQCAGARDLDESLRVRIEALNGTTVHRLLGGFPPDWKYGAENRLPLKLVVVDESSMVDVMLMRALVEALPDDCSLVLLGDGDQLPSVEAGAVLGDVVDAAADGGSSSCVVRLGGSKRFSGRIAACAAAVNAGDVAAFRAAATVLPAEDGAWTDRLDDPATASSCFFLPPAGDAAARRDACRGAVVRWAARHGLLDRDGALVAAASDPGWKTDPALSEGTLSPAAENLFKLLSRSQILAVVRRGPLGVEKINETLAAKRFGGRARGALSKPGVPVIVTRNARDLFNGDIGVTVNGPAGPVALFKRGDKVVSRPVALLPPHELAYAVTVHKSQGSEYGNVLVVLPEDERHPLLTRQLLYTGITRARGRAAILGTGAALERAVRNRLERDTGIVL